MVSVDLPENIHPIIKFILPEFSDIIICFIKTKKLSIFFDLINF
jgi:hypothetical protein